MNPTDYPYALGELKISSRDLQRRIVDGDCDYLVGITREYAGGRIVSLIVDAGSVEWSEFVAAESGPILEPVERGCLRARWFIFRVQR